MTRRAILLTLTLLLLSPVTLAAEEPLEELQPSPQRLGDRYLFDLTIHETLQRGADAPEGFEPESRLRVQGNVTLMIEIRGVERVTDFEGVERDAVAFRIEHYKGDDPVLVDDCFLWPGQPVGVRWDYLTGGPNVGYGRRQGGASGPLGEVMAPSDYYQNLTLVTGFGHTCDGYWALAGMGFMEGRVQFEGVLRPSGSFPRVEGAEDSAPATPAEFKGHRALDYVFNLSTRRPDEHVNGTYRARVAENFPVPVELELHQRVEDPWVIREVDATLRLTGFEPGTRPYPTDPGGHWGDRNTHASYRPQPRLSADVGLDLPYPFEDAFHAVTTDASTGLAQFLAEHPKAALVHAAYDAEMRAPTHLDWAHGVPDARDTDGGWQLCYLDDPDVHCVSTVRHRVASAPTGLTESWHVEMGWGSPPQPSTDPVIVSESDLLHFLDEAGIDPARVRGFEYRAFEDWPGEIRVDVRVSEVPLRTVPESSGHGRVVELDLTRGRMERVMSNVQEVHERGLVGRTLSPVTPAAPDETAPTALATGPAVAPPPPRFPTEAAAAAVTALVLVGVLVKYAALPLYSRLRRDRLLDNPVRARLYERVRAEPGIRLTELVDFTGLGNGATRHHLDQLTRHALLHEVRVGGLLSYYAAGEVPPALARREAVLRSPTHRRVLELFTEHPDLTLRDAAKRLGVSAPSVHRARKKLEKEGVLPARGLRAER